MVHAVRDVGFVHLHVHTSFSLREGALTIAKLWYLPFLSWVDVLAIAVAFMASFRAGRIIERVRVSSAAVVITYETEKASRVVWESPTAFTRVATERDEENRVMGLKVILSGRQAPVAAALSPGERSEFARALETAIWRAKRGEH